MHLETEIITCLEYRDLGQMMGDLQARLSEHPDSPLLTSDEPKRRMLGFYLEAVIGDSLRIWSYSIRMADIIEGIKEHPEFGCLRNARGRFDFIRRATETRRVAPPPATYRSPPSLDFSSKPPSLD